MIEAILVADTGVIAARIIQRCRRLGVKTVAVGLSHELVNAQPGSARMAPVGASSRLADDIVLLADVDELHDPQAVVRAAAAAGVSAIHPGRSPLRTDASWAALARAEGFVPIVTTTGAPVPSAAASAPPVPGTETVEVVFIADETSCGLLGTVGRSRDDTLTSPAPDDTERARQIARATVALGQWSGMLSVAVGDGMVLGVDAGLPVGQSAIELVTGLDLVQLQLDHASGQLDCPVEVRSRGTAITRGELDVVNDRRALDALSRSGLHLEETPLHSHGHETIVWASAFGADLGAAEREMSRYRAQLLA